MHPMRFADYRNYLLQAIEIVMQGTEAAQNQVQAIIAELPPLTKFSINSLIWPPTISLLKQSQSILPHEAAELWQKERLMLTGAASDLQRVYICYDFRKYMSAEDVACLTALQDLSQFLDRFPFTAPDEALEEHTQKEQAALAALAALPHAPDIGNELVYRWILREVGTTLAPIALKPSLMRLHYLIPLPPFTSLQVAGFAHQLPNAGRLLGWSKRALGALEDTDWLLLTWHLAGETLVLSLL